MDFQVKRSNAVLEYVFDFSSDVTEGASMVDGVTVVVSPSDDVTADVVSQDNEASTAVVADAGGAHLAMYQVKALAPLSDDEVIPRGFTLRLFND